MENLTQNYQEVTINIDHVEFIPDEQLFFIGRVNSEMYSIIIDGSMQKFDDIQDQYNKGCCIYEIVENLLYDAFIVTQ